MMSTTNGQTSMGPSGQPITVSNQIDPNENHTLLLVSSTHDDPAAGTGLSSYCSDNTAGVTTKTCSKCHQPWIKGKSQRISPDIAREYNLCSFCSGEWSLSKRDKSRNGHERRAAGMPKGGGRNGDRVLQNAIKEEQTKLEGEEAHKKDINKEIERALASAEKAEERASKLEESLKAYKEAASVQTINFCHQLRVSYGEKKQPLWTVLFYNILLIFVLSWQGCVLYYFGEKVLSTSIYNFICTYNFAVFVWFVGAFIIATHVYMVRARKSSFTWDRDYDHNHEDERADENALLKIKHLKALYGYVRYDSVGAWKVKSRKLLISYELLFQLSTARFTRPDSLEEVTWERIYHAAQNNHTVNIDRRLTVAGHNVARDTAFVAFGMYLESKRKTEKMGFPLPPAVPKVH